jgi:hypothetical protein
MGAGQYRIWDGLKWIVVLGFIFLGWPSNGSWLTNLGYLSWAVAIAGLHWSNLVARMSREDANREHARNLVQALATMATTLWWGGITLFILTRIGQVEPPTSSVLLLAAPVGLFLPITLMGLVLSSLLYPDPGDWRIHTFRSASFFAAVLPFWWVMYEFSRG